MNPLVRETVLCADIGTSSLKAALIDRDGRALASCRKSYGGQSAPAWLEAFFSALDELAVNVPAAVLVISGNGPTLVPLAKDGTSLVPRYWFSSVHAACPGPSLFLPGVHAFKTEAPDVYGETALFLSSQEWLSYMLGADPVSVLPQAAYEPFYWDREQCAEAGIDPKLFPPFVPMGSLIGKVRAARPPILPAGTPIVAGGPDFITALIGTGVLEPGMICDRAGSSEGINLCLNRADYERFGKARSIRFLPHAAEGLYNAGVIIPKSGILFEEYRKSRGDTDYQTLMEAIVRDHDHPARAVLETIASGVRAALETFDKAGLETGQNLILSGGQAKSGLWNRMKAGLIGRELLVPEIPDGELAGDAVLGMLFLESGAPAAFPSAESLRKTAARMVRIRESYR